LLDGLTREILAAARTALMPKWAGRRVELCWQRHSNHYDL